MGENEFNPIQGIFDLLGKKIDADAEAKRSQAWLDRGVMYGVDEYGRPYYRGLASPALSQGQLTGSPLVVIGVGLLAVTLVVWAIKS